MNGDEKSLLPPHDVLESEAASWVAQIDSGRMTAADRQALRQWAGRSPRHRAELEKFAVLWGELDDVLARTAAKGGDLKAEKERRALKPLWVTALRRRPLFVGTIGLAATSAMVAIGLFLALMGGYGEPYTAVYAVAQGQQRTVTLIDGTSIKINTDSVLEVSFTNEQRDVRLLRGEAFFNVAHDKTRPFSVVADDSRFEAVGTAFGVRVSAGQTTLLVEEGQVALRSCAGSFCIDQAGQQAPVLSAGEGVNVARHDGQISPTKAKEISQQLAWRDGLLVFDGDTLAFVIKEASRYTDISIIISDPAIRDLRLGGVFPLGEPEALLAAVEASFPVTVVRVDPKTIYLAANKNDE